VSWIGPPGERAECRRNASRLNIEIPRRPGPHAKIQGIRLRAIEVLGPHLADDGEALAAFDGAGDIDAQRPQRRVFVISEVEEPGALSRAIVRSNRGGDVAADCDVAVRKDDRA